MVNDKQVFSKLGFVLAAAGSAIGLGNIWRLPAQVAQFGGGTFLVVYFAICLTFGLAVLLAEFAVGRYLGPNYLHSYKEKLSENHKSTKWGLFLWLAPLGPVIILAFYFVVCGWVLFYLVQSVVGGIDYDPATANATYYKDIFSNLIVSFKSVYIYVLLFILATAAINYRGLINGIEKVNLYLIPTLFIILILMMIRSLTLDGAWAGVEYIFSFNYKIISVDLVITALKQAFFSLSLGFAVMITFSASANKTMNLPKTAFYTVALGSGVGLFTSLLIIPAAFAFGYDLQGGPSLTFITLPNLFSNLPFGTVLAALFFLLMLMAALTSTISLYEVATIFVKNLLKTTRNKAIAILFVLFALLTIIQIGSFSFLSHIKIGKLDIFDFTSNLADSLLVFFGIFSCLFAGYLFSRHHIKNEISSQAMYHFRLYSIWLLFIKYLAPVVLLALLYLSLVSLF